MPSDTSNAQIITDMMDPARAQALATTLELDVEIRVGTAMPTFFHQAYFWAPQPPQGLGRDGHPGVGGLIPDMGLPRRMWAGGALSFRAPLLAGHPAEKRSTLLHARHKNGRSGPLGFVTLRHEIWQDGRLCIAEHQDLVYRQDPAASATPPIAPQARNDETDYRPANFSSTLLFRYSALTFNGHRIHYDLDYARDVEGYGGLVVHGPLLAQLLMLEAEKTTPLTSFSFRASSPLMHFETADLCRNGPDAWVRSQDGQQCMSAKINKKSPACP